MTSPIPVWQDRPYTPRAALAADVRADVCVVGGGVGGVATAWRLAARGARVVLLEAGTVAGGATGRNGGFFIAGAAPMYHETRARWGRERARRVHAATLAGQAGLLELATATGAGPEIRVTGLLRVGMDAAEAADVTEHQAALAQDGFPGELVEAGALPPALRRDGRRALHTPQDGTMDPVAVVRAIAGEAERLGARIFEGSPAAPPSAGREGVDTPGGRVLADTVVIAADAGVAGLTQSAAAVRPRRLNACATAPAPPGLLPQPVYARYGYEYAQQRPDGRIVLGGFSDLDGPASWTDRAEVSGPVQARLESYLRAELGVAAPVTHRWAGVVGFAEDPLPRCGPVTAPSHGRRFGLGGYNGTGVIQAFVAARIVSELILDGESADADLYAPLDA